jgi:STIP1 family protein 1
MRQADIYELRICHIPEQTDRKRPAYRIIADPKNPALYTNRAMARLKMSLWDSVIADCNDCLRLGQDNMKAHYYLSQAYLSLHNYADALDHAQRAHELCVRANDKSLASITAQVLKCKKERWEDMERRRRREGNDLEAEVIAMMQRERDEALQDRMEDGERREVEAEWEQKLATMRRVFEKARAAEERRRKVPNWAIDDISFMVMVDPVMVSLVQSSVCSIQLLTFLGGRPRLATRMSEPRSWNTSGGTRQILSHGSPSQQRTCGQTLL